MTVIFEHSQGVLDFAYRLVKEYDDHQKDQDKIERAKTQNNKTGLQFKQGRWFSDDRIRHGMTGSPEYITWQNIRRKGNQVCESWRKSFVAFFNDVGKKPDKTYQLKRQDPAGKFEPGNCTWKGKA